MGAGYYIGMVAGCLFFFGAPVALWFAIWPSRSWPLASARARNIQVFLALLIGMPIIMSIGIGSDPTYRKEQAEKEAAKASRARAENAVTTTTTPEATTITDTAPDTPEAAADHEVSSNGGLDYLGMKAEAEQQLKAKLTDDHGLRYRDVHTKLSTLEGGGIVAFCGEVNSRTPLGGYGGYKRFLASRSVAATEDTMSADDFAQAWSRFCTDGVEGPKVWF